MSRPEDQAREHIDAALDLAGWAVQDRGAINLDAARGVAIHFFEQTGMSTDADPPTS